MFLKVLKIAGLCVLGVGGVALLCIPFIGWVTGAAALGMVAVGAGACVATIWGAEAMVRHESTQAAEVDLSLLQAELAAVQQQNADLDHQISLTQQTLLTTASLKKALDGTVANQTSVTLMQDQQIVALQNDLQAKDSENGELKKLLLENAIPLPPKKKYGSF
jgi:hypothetical protein